MPRKRSIVEKVQDYFSLRIHGTPSTSPRRSTISEPQPFSSQNHIRLQDLQRLQDAPKGRPANADNPIASSSSSQDARQHKPKPSFSKRVKADLKAGIDEANAVLLGEPTIPRRAKSLKISAPIGPANLADSTHIADSPKGKEDGRTFTKITRPIRTVPAHTIRLNPPRAHKSVHVDLSRSLSSPPPRSNREKRETRWEDFLDPTAPPLPPRPAHQGVVTRKPLPSQDANGSNRPLCRLCRSQPEAAAGLGLCRHCTSLAFLPDDARPNADASLPPAPPLEESSYIKRKPHRARPNADASLPPVPSLEESSYIKRKPHRALPSHTYHPSHSLPDSPLTKAHPNALAGFTFPDGDPDHSHPALRRPSFTVPFAPESSRSSIIHPDPSSPAFASALASGAVQHSPRRGAISATHTARPPSPLLPAPPVPPKDTPASTKRKPIPTRDANAAGARKGSPPPTSTSAGKQPASSEGSSVNFYRRGSFYGFWDEVLGVRKPGPGSRR
ncbi:hypothetical protein MMC08_006185 [Hypocenomyce scalaris]|nr:hypothetical protein [Hypocenomyce scalaris]